MNYQKLILVGNVTRDAERRTAREAGTSYVTFRVGVRDARDRSVFFPITVFGRQGEAIVGYLTKGREVLVEGRIEARETGRLSVVADRVVLGTSSGKEKSSLIETSTDESK